MKFANRKFTSSTNVEDDIQKPKKPFVRDESDNKLFSRIQIKDITDIITEDCVGAWDFDGVVYRACANMENRLIKVENEKEGISEILPNLTTFKGRGKKVSDTSWLGLRNIDRELEGKEPLTVDDFEITDVQELKMDREKAVEQVKIQIFMKIKQVKQQYRIPNIKILLGGGSNFRVTELNQAKLYKGQRKEMARPLLLKEIREWVLAELDSEFAHPLPDGRLIECDDLSNMYGIAGYNNYRRHGKFNFIEISPDKDGLAQAGKLLINPDTHTGEHNPLKGKFKFPNAMLIHISSKDVGDVELVVGSGKTPTKTIKGYGFKFLMYQAILGKDAADCYNCFGDIGISLGDVEAYKILKPCKTSQEALQACLDVLADKTPYGVQYTDHRGVERDVDSLTYANEYFKTAYMLRNKKDNIDLFKLCDAMGVDTSRVIGNNTMSAPKKVFEPTETTFDTLKDLVSGILEEDLKGLKSKAKKDITPVLDTITEKLKGIDWDEFYTMKQVEK